MYNRPVILFPLALLAVLALLTLWIDRSVQAPEPKPDGSTRHDPDYILTNFVTTKTDVNGDIRSILRATEMRTGMIYNKKKQTMTLLKDVRVHYERPAPPQPRARPTKASPRKATRN